MPASTTVIAALKFQGGVLIAADSQASDMTAGVRWPVEKLDRLPNLPCVIGFSGSVGKGDIARQRLADARFHTNTFAKSERIQAAVRTVLSPIYQDIKNESYPPGTMIPDIALWGLTAMWAENDARILEFEANGDSSFHDHFHAVGSGSQTAYAIYRTLGGRRLSGLDQPRATSAILRILRTCVDVEMWGVSEPLGVWVLTATSVRKFGPDEIQTHLQGVDEWIEREQEFLFPP
jgi:20S proteasome alpha/beta subunit